VTNDQADDLRALAEQCRPNGDDAKATARSSSDENRETPPGFLKSQVSELVNQSNVMQIDRNR
jgi:hypothetical protein